MMWHRRIHLALWRPVSCLRIPGFRVLCRGTLGAIVLGVISLGLASCGGAGSSVVPPPPVTKLTVNPLSTSVDAGATITFTGVFTPTTPAGGSLTWSITPVGGGTITDAGVLTASATAGSYSVLATWTPALSSKAAIIKGMASLKVLAVPQLDAVITPAQVQATGADQSAGAIQNGSVAGQAVPSVAATDSGGTTQVVSGFTIPTSPGCTGSNADCK
jgi:hypothetical protein